MRRRAAYLRHLPTARARGQYLLHVFVQTLADYARPKCLWGTENAKKPHNKQYVDGLRTVKQALEQRNRDLENENRRLRASLGLPSPVDERQDESGLVEAAEQVLDGPSPGSSSSSHQSYKDEELDEDDDIAAIAAPLHHLHVRRPNASIHLASTSDGVYSCKMVIFSYSAQPRYCVWAPRSLLLRHRITRSKIASTSTRMFSVSTMRLWTGSAIFRPMSS